MKEHKDILQTSKEIAAGEATQRRQAFDVDNPQQAKRSSGLWHGVSRGISFIRNDGAMQRIGHPQGAPLRMLLLSTFFLLISSFSFAQTPLPVEKIVALEYFIDRDPGFGRAARVEVAAGTDIEKTIDGISVAALDEGLHTVYVRALSRFVRADGTMTDSMRWSTTQRRTFYRIKIRTLPAITAMEYFVDSDPGFGHAHPIVVNSPAAALDLFPVNIELDEANGGAHTLYIRARNAEGRWSITQQRTFQQFYQHIAPDITALEYFVDNDPGFGNATQLSFAGTEGVRLFTADITAVTPGMHSLYVRARNALGHWSITQNITFVKADMSANSPIEAVEYFIDRDPGFDHATAVPIAAGQNVSATFNVIPDTLAEGLHTLYIRARNANRRWSITQRIDFLRLTDDLPANINAYEWFIDSDPGFGRTTTFTVIPPAATLQRTITVNISALDAGMHCMYVRVRDTRGAWSIVQRAPFVKADLPDTAPLAAVEWFIDSDPGFGAANGIAVTGTEAERSFVLDLSAAVGAGLKTDTLHSLYFRGKNTAGRWGVTQRMDFFLYLDTAEVADVEAVEWFIDSDPGYGAATPVAGIAPARNVIHAFQVNTASLADGWHHLFVRARNSAGKWSVTQHQTFVKAKTRELTAVEWFIDSDLGFGKNTIIGVTGGGAATTFAIPAATLNTLGIGPHCLYMRGRDSHGAWGITQHFDFFVVPVKETYELSEIEWFIDNDPGFGQGSRTAVGGKAADKVIAVPLNDLPAGVHTLYMRALNSGGRWGITQSIPFIVAEIPAQYTTPDVVAVEWFFDSDPGYGQAVRVPVDAAERVQKTFAVPVNSLGTGVHSFYLRALDAAGHWGVTHRQTFVKADIPANFEPAKMQRLEWFIDADPGFGAATAVDLPAEASTGVLFPVNLAEWADGPHTLYIRALDEHGRWSITQTIGFYRTDIPIAVNKDIVYLEWFMDTDPGFGAATSVPLALEGEDVSQSVFISTDDVWPGAHTIYFRARDGRGLWTITQYVELLVVDNPRLGGYPDIVEIEWFLDNDPGFGQANLVSVASAGLNIRQSIFIPMNDVSEGMHVLYMRGRNSKGEWSITQHLLLFCTGVPLFDAPRNIEAFEWFIDRDPGVGSANRVPALVPAAATQQRITVTADTLSEGMHNIYIRALDNEGQWSHTQHFSFIRTKIRPDYPLRSLEWFIDADPGFGRAQPVSLTPATDIDRLFNIPLSDTLAMGTHTLYIRAQNAAGEWTITQYLDFTRIAIRKTPDITAVEYFIDTDPGFGAGEPLPIPVGDAPVTAFIPLSDLTEGLHTLHVRTLNAEGSWSVTQWFEFTTIRVVRDYKITALEYFIDDDPGFGAAVQVPVTPAAALTKTFAIDMSAYPTGMHTLYLRARDEKGDWSITQNLEFIVMGEDIKANIVGYEWFIDRDPGFGNGVGERGLTPLQHFSKTVTVNTSGLSTGVHTIYVRVLDDQGAWSITQRNTFIRVELPARDPVTAVEWFIDADPGFGEAHRVAATTTTFNVIVDETTTPGVHTLYIRALNATGDWGVTQNISFVALDPEQLYNIVALEWFIDSDPGYGKATAVPIATPALKVTRAFTVDISGIGDGLHNLFVRALDEKGRWSITHYGAFVKVSKPEVKQIKGIEWFIDDDPGFGEANRLSITDMTQSYVLNLTDMMNAGLASGAHTLYFRACDEAGKWSITQWINFVLYRDERGLSPIKEVEWFIDSDPGYGQAPASQHFIFADPPHVLIQPFHVDVTVLDEGMHRLFIRARDTAGHWGVTQHETFFKIKSREISEIEWFLDTDRGFGANHRLPVTGDAVTFTVPASELREGVQTLYVRGLNKAGSWGVTQWFNLVTIAPRRLPPGVEAAEWFVDNDPGFGEANRFSVSDEAAFTVNADAFGEGLHTLYIRALDKTGRWSITQYIPFYTLTVEDSPDINGMEWFIDYDPGFGRATAVPVTPGQQISRTVTVSLQFIDPGLHRFYTRVHSNGRWSITQYVDFVRVVNVEQPSPITRVEWFVDDDPGFGAANAVPNITPSQNIDLSFVVDVRNRPDGPHTLYIRAQSDTGRWSITQNIEFLKVTVDKEILPELAALEYFFDTDPGYGRATAVPLSGVHAIKTFNAVMPSNLQAGVHTMFVRAMDTLQHWGVTQYISFLKVDVPAVPAELTAMEWFIDNDPGFGEAHGIAIDPTQRTFDHTFFVNAEDVTLGAHTLYVRSRDTDGRWSITQNIPLVVADMRVAEPFKVMALEYFFDKDPGFGAAKRINISPTSHNADRRFFVAADELATLGDGIHTLYIRGMNEDRRWSITHNITIVKMSNITSVPDDVMRLEYFFDLNDPGFGQAKPVPVSPDNNIDKYFTPDVSDLELGIHTLYIRAISKTGRWSITQYTVNLELKVMDPEEPNDEPVGGTLTPSSTDICQYSKTPVTLTLNNYALSINWWEYRRYDENGALLFGWRTASNSANHETMTFIPDEAGIWEYRVHVSRGDRGPAYSTIARITVIGAAKGGKVTANTPEYICSGKPIELTLEEYKGDIVGWQQRLGDDAWTAIDASAGEAVITVTPDRGGLWYYRAETAMGECSNAFSDSIALPVIDATTGGYITPDTIRTCSGSSFELQAKDYLGVIDAWERSTDHGQSWTRIGHPDKYYTLTAGAVGDTTLYRAVVKAGNCDDTYSAPAAVIVVKEIADAGQIVGPDFLCLPAMDVSYSVPVIAAAEEYVWTLPTGAEFASNPSEREIRVNFLATAQSGDITVKGRSTRCGEGVASTLPVTVATPPAAPVIVGDDELSVGNVYTYTVDNPQPGVTYTWTIPVGWTIIATTDHSITLMPNGLSGDVICTATGPSGCTSQSAKNVIVKQCVKAPVIYRLPNMR